MQSEGRLHKIVEGKKRKEKKNLGRTMVERISKEEENWVGKKRKREKKRGGTVK